MLLHEYARAYNSVHTNGVQVQPPATGVSYTPQPETIRPDLHIGPSSKMLQQTQMLGLGSAADQQSNMVAFGEQYTKALNQ